MPFHPVAIVGRACVLPGALSPEELWARVRAGEDLVSDAPAERWRIDDDLIDCARPEQAQDRTWSRRGGYVRGFESVFDPTGLRIDADLARRSDPQVQWVLHCGREALAQAREVPLARTGVVLGNLSFPTDALNRFAERAWAGLAGPNQAHDRFVSGLPALRLAEALGLGGGAMCLDAACASALYAIRLACDRLADREIDVALAGAVNRTDDLFIHVGFCALQAMSRTGQSRPFHADADGLVPAEGCVIFALKRLEDAERDGDTIHGVIRGVGLSNDGRTGGLLAPAAEGQVRCMKAAYQMSGLSPDQVDVVECHATGTIVGDKVELDSLSEVFGRIRRVPLGSLKSNFGHAITAAGGAGLLKVLGAMQAGELAPTRHEGALSEGLLKSPFRLVTGVEPWESPGVRRAAVSAFGFGGNNAHLIVEQHHPGLKVTPSAAPELPIAVVAMAVRAADLPDTAGFEAAVLGGTSHLSGERPEGRRTSVELGLTGLRFPPRDMEQALAQQVLMLDVAREVVAQAGDLPRLRTGVIVGMGADAEISRYGVRWRMAQAARQAGVAAGPLAAARDAVVPLLRAAGVLGTMPNIPANRLHAQFDLAGPGYSVSSEQLSGLDALRIAVRGLRSGELDAAVVGAVDLSCEPVHALAAAALGLQGPPGDAAVALVLRRLDDAVAAGQPVLAVLGGGAEAGVLFGEGGHQLGAQLGEAHAASGLLHVAAAISAVSHRARPGRGGLPVPWVESAAPMARVEVTALTGARAGLTVQGGPARRLDRGPAPQLWVFAGPDRAAVAARLASAQVGGEGPARLVIVAASAAELQERALAAAGALAAGASPAGTGLHWREAPVGGELAFVFGGAGAAYAGAGREFLLTWPALAPALPVGGVFEGREPATALEHLWTATTLAQAHARWTQEVLGLKPSAVLGCSSGESNGLLALGAWRDLPALADDLHQAGLFHDELAGELRALGRAWGTDTPRWAAWVVRAEPARVKAAIAGEARVHLLMVHTPQECTIGGEREGCDRVLRALGGAQATPLRYGLAAHVPELETVGEAWRALHRRETHSVPGVRFFGGPDGRRYRPTAAAAERAIYDSAVGTVDVPALVEAAYSDGVRIFVEHGPRGVMTRWISEILGDRPHLAVALDAPGPAGARSHAEAVAALVAAGVPIAADALRRAFPSTPTLNRGPSVSLPAHPAPVQIPSWYRSFLEDAVPQSQALSALPRPPYLPPVTEGGGVPWAAVVTEPAPLLDGARLLGGGEAPRIVRLPEDPAAGVQVAASGPVLAPPRPATVAPARPVVTTAPAAASARPVGTSAPAVPAAASAGGGAAATNGAASVPAPVVGAPAVGAGPLAALAELQRGLADAHTQFLAQQAAAHARFLQVRADAQALLLAATQQVGPAASAAVVAPVAPAVSAPVAPAVSAPVAPVVSAPKAAVVAAPVVPSVAPVKPAPVAPAKPAPSASATAAPAKPAPISSAAAAPAKPPAPPHKPSAVEPRGPNTGPRAMVPAAQLPGPKLSREQLMVHSSGRISEIFGPAFAGQDGYHRQVRMPEPPLLLADRMVGLDCVPNKLGRGTIWTETDVREDSWYLHRGYMPAGVMIEAGQADLMLISYMGIDAFNQSERIYRLLGCTLTYHDHLPRPGETLRYDIHCDGHAKHGDVRLFFFHYDCVVDGQPRLTVRGGQAGFFTEQELANSDGILWTPQTGEHDPSARRDPPEVVCTRSSFTTEQIAAFANGDALACFGPGFEYAAAHNDPPRISPAPMTFFQRIDELSHDGGPWRKGYLRATWEIKPDDWFFEGHFKNDPCMPGTLMFEGCLQALSFYLAAMGYTVHRDGWSFQPVPDNPIDMRCRGQVTPRSKVLTYEVFVEEVIAGPVPTIYADLLCTVDGLGAFHARRCGLRLVPDWPLNRLAKRELAEPVPVAPVYDFHGHKFDRRAMLACAWGRPTDAFGPMYAPYDSHRKVPRLPGPPYHFMSRVEHVDGKLNGMQVKTKARIAYDIPPDAWYFDENNQETMPFCVFLEAALQPCGWLASAVGSALTIDMDVFFRNLDGTGTLRREITRDAGTLITEVEITGISNAGGMIIESFEVVCSLGGEPVYDMKTVFGFFPPDAFANQKGLAPSKEDHRWRTEPSDFLVDLTSSPARYCAGSLRLASPKLRMIDRITGYWPDAGAAGLGRVRSEKDVNPAEWFFKAHFFQDPVQPGSLGIEAMVQVLQFYMLERGLGEGMKAPRFESLGVGAPLTWKYRGQVVPRNKLISVDLEVTEVRREAGGVVAIATSTLWVDGLCIYSAKNLGMRIVDGEPEGARAGREASDGGPWQLSLKTDPWIADHRPTWTVAALPMTGVLDLMARAAAAHQPGARVVALEDVVASRWVTVGPEPVEVSAQVEGTADGALRVVLTAGGQRVSAGVVRLGEGWEPAPTPFEPLRGALRTEDRPYDGGSLFHGPALQLVRSITWGEAGSRAVIDAFAPGLPVGLLRPGLLDAALHGIPHDGLRGWSNEVPEGVAAYPYKVRSLRLHGALPGSGRAVAEARLIEVAAGRPVLGVQLSVDGALVASLELEEVLLPKGPIGVAAPADRARFLRDRLPVPGLGLSRDEGGVTVTLARDVQGSDWLPGTVAAAYGVAGGDLVEAVALRDHGARRFGVHPSALDLVGTTVRDPSRPITSLQGELRREAGVVRVSGEPALDLTSVRAWWAGWFGFEVWPVADLYYGLIERFVREVRVEDPAALAAAAGRPILFFGNHQVGIESLLFSILASTLVGRPTVTIAKVEHQQTWLGRLIQHAFSWPGARDPALIRYFDRSRAESMGELLATLGKELAAGERALMVHVDGTRSLAARRPVQQISGAFLDLALEIGAAIVPVRFVGGLPVEELEARLEFPLGMGQQDYWFGRPILAETLRALPLKERKGHVLAALNGLGPALAEEVPLAGDPGLQAAVAARVARTGVLEAHAVVMEVLRGARVQAEETKRLVAAAEGGELRIGEGERELWLRELAGRLLG
jgi:acyl transferase domain-containing protein/3-hydroxymyristoyl/3-hydroxydecanoyl-(acyl carrier protein) dehydratase/1-acyl-sn-glycerol-3-phosphate acyltransferase